MLWRAAKLLLSILAMLMSGALCAQPPTAAYTIPGIGAKALTVDRFGDPLPRGALSRIGTVRFRHGSCVWVVAFSPDGHGVAAGDAAGYVRLWDVNTGKDLWTVRLHRYVDAITFAPDGKTLVVAGSVNGGSTLVKLEARTGRDCGCILRTTEPSSNARTTCIKGAAFSTDGKLLAVGVLNDTIRVLDSSTGMELQRMTGSNSGVSSHCFSSDGKLLAGPTSGSGFGLWDAQSGKKLWHFSARSSFDSPVFFFPGGGHLAVTADAVHILDVAKGTELCKLAEERRHSIGAMAITPDGKTLLTGAIGEVKLWDIATTKEIRTMGRNLGSILSIAVSPDGTTVAAAAFDDALVRLWKTDTGKEAFMPESGHVHVKAVDLAHDGRTILAVGDGGRIDIYDALTGRRLRNLVGPDDGAFRAVFSPDGLTVAETCIDGMLRLRNASSGQLIHEWKAHRTGPSFVAFSPDGRSLVSVDRTNTICLSDVSRGEIRQRIVPQDVVFHGVHYTPCGRYIVTHCNEDQIRIWNPTTGKLRRTIPISAKGSVTFSPDGRMIAAGGRGTPVVLWEMITGSERLRLNERTDSATALAFGPNNDEIAVG